MSKFVTEGSVVRIPGDIFDHYKSRRQTVNHNIKKYLKGRLFHESRKILEDADGIFHHETKTYYNPDRKNKPSRRHLLVS